MWYNKDTEREVINMLIKFREVIKMLIKFREKIEHCKDCPFKASTYEFGFCADVCSLIGCYDSIPSVGIRSDCPLAKKERGLISRIIKIFQRR